MKANRRYLQDSDDGASVIVGAILLFALSFLVLVMIQSNFVPVWEQDAEAAHAQTIRSQMTYLKSQMERQVDEAITTPLSAPIDMDRSSATQVFGNRNIPPGILELGDVDSSAFNLTSAEISVATVTDPAFVGVGEAWDVVDGDTVEDVSRLASLRVRFGVDAKPYTTEWAYLEVTDANGDFAGRLSINLLQMATNGNGVNGAEFWVQTEDSSGSQIGAQYFEANNQKVPAGSEPPYAWVNALNPDYRFDRIVGSAAAPITLTLTTTGGMPADFAAAYYQFTTGGGQILVGGGTDIFTDYERIQLGRPIKYDFLPQYYVDQDIVLEYGGLLLIQEDAATMSSPPAMAVGTAQNRTSVSWTVPLTTSSTDQGSAQLSGLVITSAFDHSVLTASAPSITLSIATEYPSAWTNYWRNTFELAGLTQGNEFSVSSTATSATLTLDGPLSDTTYDVSLALQTAQVEVIL